MKLVKVFWQDIHSNDDWLTREEVVEWVEKRMAHCLVSVGYLIEDDPTNKYIIIGSGYDSFDKMEYERVLVIPRDVILKVIQLKDK